MSRVTGIPGGDVQAETYESRAVRLLRGLAGRLSDGTLETLWSLLGAGELVLLQEALFGGLTTESCGLSPDEVRLLRELLGNPDDRRLPEVRVLAPDEPRPAYRFTGFAADEPDPIADEVATQEASGHNGVRRVLRALRLPANSVATAPVTWVYLVESEAGSYLPHALAGIPSGFLLKGLGSRYPVEPVAEGESLPSYQAAALAAGRQIWPAVDTGGTTYYGRLAAGRPPEDPSGVLRTRTTESGETVEEVFSRKLIWEPSDFLFRYHMLGDNDVDYVEISKDQADAFVARVTKQLGGGEPGPGNGRRRS